MPKSNKIYLDYASSVSANPSSIHALGVEASKKLHEARAKVAGVLGARKEEIIFTSGGTESNNLAIQGVILASEKRGFLPHIVTTNIEHPSVLDTCRMLEERGLAKVSIVPVEPNGIVDVKKIKKAINKNTVLVSVMYANNEIGTIQPIREIAREIRHWKKNRKGPEKTSTFPVFHTDAVQGANYLDLNVERLGVDLLSLSGSKIEESGRVGMLYKRKSVSLKNIFGGGDQEMGLRPGTENLPEILKFSSALESAQKIKEREGKRLAKLRDYFLKKLQMSKTVFDIGLLVNGDLKKRLPNNLSISFSKIPSDLLIIELSAKDIMTSSKSACKSSRAEGSYVISALRPDFNPEIGAVRFSFGKQTKKKDLDRVVTALSQIFSKLSKWY